MDISWHPNMQGNYQQENERKKMAAQQIIECHLIWSVIALYIMCLWNFHYKYWIIIISKNCGKLSATETLWVTNK